MTQFARAEFNAASQLRFNRRPIVAVLIAAFIFSVMHCAGCGMEFAKAQSSIVKMTGEQSSLPDLPEQSFALP